jgi:hypothetical protein
MPFVHWLRTPLVQSLFAASSTYSFTTVLTLQGTAAAIVRFVHHPPATLLFFPVVRRWDGMFMSGAVVIEENIMNERRREWTRREWTRGDR